MLLYGVACFIKVYFKWLEKPPPFWSSDFGYVVVIYAEYVEF